MGVDNSHSDDESSIANSTDDNDNSSGDQSHQTSSSSEFDKFNIATKEHRAVLSSKALVFVTLLLSSVTLGLVTYFLTSNEEQDDFTTQFADYATEVGDIVDQKAHNLFGVMDSLATAITSDALFHDTEWPFYSIHHFEERGSDARALSQAELIAFTPIVTKKQRRDWEDYAVVNKGWIEDGLAFQQTEAVATNFPYHIANLEDGLAIDPNDEGPFSPIWQMSAVPPDTTLVNSDMLGNDIFRRLVDFADHYDVAAFSEVFDVSTIFGATVTNPGHPQTMFVQPVHASFEEDSAIVGHIAAVVNWDKSFQDILHKGADGIVVVLADTCDEEYTYRIDGTVASFVGRGDLHEPAFDDMVVERKFATFADTSDLDSVGLNDHCEYFLKIYPSSDLQGSYQTSAPFLYTLIVVLIFFGTSMTFVLYDCFVTRRQAKVMFTAARTNQIVHSLFPKKVREQLMSAEVGDNKNVESPLTDVMFDIPKAGLKSFLKDNEVAGHAYATTKPIADLFPNTTVMFADISGFTAWSSVREPSQVFTLLETVYHAYDVIAKQRRVFKVETVGDCYVAVAGLPEARSDHAVVMARFARDCMDKFNELVHQLETHLGPDTSDLAMRLGLHSGPVTAGVLRGERARFQLFGDTVNTAARMESTGTRNRIHVSQETADLLKDAGKEHWLKVREDIVVAKGKGALQTYWLFTTTEVTASDAHSTAQGDMAKVDMASPQATLQATQKAANSKNQRLIDWNCELLTQLLKKIVGGRGHQDRLSSRGALDVKRLEARQGNDGLALEEVVEIVKLPQFDAEAAKDQIDPRSVELGDQVMRELRDYVGVLASMYRQNPFHCFEHASHVTMSVSKLLARIVAPDIDPKKTGGDMAHTLHDHTYGITSDPLTQFAVVLSALMHDVDHRGVPNSVLVQEDPTLGMVYCNKSVAEQNSVDLAWNALMDPAFERLRNAIYTNEAEFSRFRQLIVNSVMATDIFDKELGQRRKQRWEKAFAESATTESATDEVNRKATIVIEHLIQASDVSHTMQHWHVYQKWNERLFQEMYLAFKQGRSSTDPSEGWYQGEIGFFDHYVIPLAKKLKDCGVFGVSSDEYLNYAINNRKEWESKGALAVARMVEKFSEDE